MIRAISDSDSNLEWSNCVESNASIVFRLGFHLQYIVRNVVRLRNSHVFHVGTLCTGLRVVAAENSAPGKTNKRNEHNINTNAKTEELREILEIPRFLFPQLLQTAQRGESR